MQVSGRSKYSSGLHAVKMIWQQIRPTDPHKGPPPSPTRGMLWRTRDELCGIKRRKPLMRGLSVFSVSGTSLALGLRVGFFSSHLTSDKLFPVELRAITSPPNLSLLLEIISTPALIIKPWLTLVTHTGHNVQPGEMDASFQPQQDCQPTKCYARADYVLNHKLYSN